jgi:hypothetical protein
MLIESNMLCFLFIGVMDQHGIPEFLNESIIQWLSGKWYQSQCPHHV